MKKLRLFDSLKFMRAMFVAVVAIFAFAPAHADTTAIQSVIAYGKTEQSATPTPTNPVPIMTNNGVLTASKNLFDATQLYGMYLLTDTGEVGSASSTYGLYRYFDVKPNTTYTFSYVSSSDSQYRRVCGYDNTGTFTELLLKVARSQGGVAGDSIMLDFTTGATTTRIAISTRVEDTNIILREKSVYTNGLTETIRDAAGHKATAQMLLSVGDYKDEQNITTGAITRRVGIKVLDGTESWDRVFVYGNVKNVVIAPLSSIAPDAKTLKNKIRCSHFRTYDGGAFTGNTAGIDWASTYYNSTPSVGIQVPGITTSVAQFKSWLAEQYANGTPVIVLYPLATETTESVATQSLTTAPVRQTLGAIMNMPIKTILTDNTEIMSGANELIKIATTKYNEESFTDVQDALTGVFNAVDTVVSQTMTQAQQIDQIATNKQTRPNEGCDAKYCLLVEDEDGTPHWYPIAGANGVEYVLPSGYTQLEYIESNGTQYIDTGIIEDATYYEEVDFQFTSVAQDRNYLIGHLGSSGDSKDRTIIGMYKPNSPGYYFSFGDQNLYPLRDDNAFGECDTNRHTAFQDWVNLTYGVDNQTLPKSSFQYSGSGMKNYLFAASSGDGPTGFAYARIYHAIQKKNGVAVRDFVPAKNDSNVVGMYDLVSGQFFINAGTGDFIAGPDM